jgi:hypothetical protein
MSTDLRYVFENHFFTLFLQWIMVVTSASTNDVTCGAMRLDSSIRSANHLAHPIHLDDLITCAYRYRYF